MDSFSRIIVLKNLHRKLVMRLESIFRVAGKSNIQMSYVLIPVTSR